MNDMTNQPAKPQDPIRAGERSAADPSGTRTEGDSRVAPADIHPAPASLMPASVQPASAALHAPILQQRAEPVPQAVNEPVTRNQGPPAVPQPETASATPPGNPSVAPAAARPGSAPEFQPGSENAVKRDMPTSEQSRSGATSIPLPEPGTRSGNQPASPAPTPSEPQHSEERADPLTSRDPVTGPFPLFGEPAKTPNGRSTDRALTTSNVDPCCPQYPDDTDEELKVIADGIINSRAKSVPARQVKANASRIRGLLKNTCNVKETYYHLVSEGRIDPTKVSYKQFALQVSQLS